MIRFFNTAQGAFLCVEHPKCIPESDCKAGDECACYKKWLAAALKRREVLEIPIHWGGEGMDSRAYEMLGKPTWCFDCEKLDAKFATFDIFDEYDGDKEYFCRGVVIDLDEVWPSRNYTQIVMEQTARNSMRNKNCS